MSRRPRRNHTPAFKAKVALATIKGDRTLAPARLRHVAKASQCRFSRQEQSCIGQGRTAESDPWKRH
jgi:transposase-like protein